MNFREFLKEHIVYLDGGMGTLLQKEGIPPGEHPERWNISHPQVIQRIQREYFEAGSNVVNTCTFGANRLKFGAEEMEAIIRAAVENAVIARDTSEGEQEKYIALDIGPTGKMLKPYGDFDFEEAVETFAEMVRLGVKYGVDLITVETMNDSYETKAALLAVKENSDLPVIVTNAYGEDGKLMTGADPEAMVAMLEGMGADAIGCNCSFGPEQLKPVVKKLLECASVPVVVKPNAGLPKVVQGETVYDVEAADFAEALGDMVKAGVRAVGGCCGTTPKYIEALVRNIAGAKPASLTEKGITWLSSYTHSVKFGAEPLLIGERINPTGKKLLKASLLNGDFNQLLNEAISQQEEGAHILDINVGTPGIDEADVLREAVCRVQAIVDLPLQIDTANLKAMETALRRYNGKALINSVTGKKESMEGIFPLVKKYGGLVVCLTLDEDGIPETVEGRVAIAEKIIETAAKYGIDKKELVFDTLALTVSADQKSPAVTLSALEHIRKELGCHTSLGVSNVSFGLPYREAVNSTFFTMALERGLSAAIMNPGAKDMMKAYYGFKALRGMDENCESYVEKAKAWADEEAPSAVSAAGMCSGEGKGSASSMGVQGEHKPAVRKSGEEGESRLQRAIVKGLKEEASEITAELIKEAEPMGIVHRDIIPALDIVGKGFEEKTVFLPQLLMSAEAAKSAFEVIKAYMPAKSDGKGDKPKVVVATVHGDVHDIGKNIVKLLLENYGFDVTDLGKDVPPQVIVDKVVSEKIPIVGLSALMTTTLPAMEETIKLLKEGAPWCRIVVGGAVLTRSYAGEIGADRYAADAMETVRFAEEN